MLIKRDDLLPFPLAGNKVRKLTYEFQRVDPHVHTIITVGSVHSNHCRTTALMAAQRGVPLRLVLHDEGQARSGPLSQRMLMSLGAVSDVVAPEEIRTKIERMFEEIRVQGREPYLIQGGCHTPRGVTAYRDAVRELASQIDHEPDVIVVASGTGATQAGIIAGCRELGWVTRVVGVSVARRKERGTAAVEEALRWVMPNHHEAIEFTDDYVAGGYGMADAATTATVQWAWRHGLPLDPVYTGKAMTAVREIAETGDARKLVVFWHTGGLFQALSNWI
jgi:1-aminocyclopropane-1-carboxylate deaminase/D-cysteine desulfhydrase-like pyridoxal-dependent ACC family enzyme